MFEEKIKPQINRRTYFYFQFFIRYFAGDMQNLYMTMKTKLFYIGIDDTDNQFTRGTGHRAKQLAEILHQLPDCKVLTVSRHQLFFDPRVPYTSHNSSACLVVETSHFATIKNESLKFLLKIAADGSDVGLCIAAETQISQEIVFFGQTAKIDIVTQKQALTLSKSHNIYLEGLTGTHDGIIGALAGIALRFDGNDGRCMWVKGRELKDISGIMSQHELANLNIFDKIENEQGNPIPDSETINLGEWVRPILKNNYTTLIAEEVKNEKFKWRLKSKEYIKDISN